MIDWLYSKIGVMVASLIFLSSFIAIFSAMNESLRDNQASVLADRIAETIDNVYSTQGEVVATISTYESGENMSLPGTIIGEEYGVRIFYDTVWIVRLHDADRPWAFAPLHNHVITCKPVRSGCPGQDISDAEQMSRVVGLLINPIDLFHVERRQVLLSGITSYLTFVYS